MRFVTQRAHLVAIEGLIHRPVADARARAAGRGALDHVRAGTDHRAHDTAHLVDAVADTVRQRGIVREEALVTRGAHLVTDATDRRDDRHRRVETWAPDEAFFHGGAEA